MGYAGYPLSNNMEPQQGRCKDYRPLNGGLTWSCMITIIMNTLALITIIAITIITIMSAWGRALAVRGGARALTIGFGPWTRMV